MKTNLTSLGELCQLIRESINIVDFCEQNYNAVFIPGKNGWFNTLCFMPEHLDTNPSLGVNADTSTFHCFGCGAKGSVIDLVMIAEGLDLRQSIDYLLEYLNIQPEIASTKFHAIKRLLKASSPRLHRDLLLEAKIKQLKRDFADTERDEYYNRVCDIFDSYAKSNDAEFQNMIYQM
jgi:DNA primase